MAEDKFTFLPQPPSGKTLAQSTPPPTSVSDMRSFMAYLLKNGYSKTNRYRVRFDLPNLRPVDWDYINRGIMSRAIIEGLMFQCESIDLPSANIEKMDVRIGTDLVPVPNDIGTDSIAITMRVSQDMWEKKFFDSWQSLIFDFASGMGCFPEDYLRNIIIEVLNMDDKVMYKLTLVDAYPVSMQSINLSHANESEYMKLQVNIAFRRWLNEKDESKSSIYFRETQATSTGKVEPKTGIQGAIDSVFGSGLTVRERITNINHILKDTSDKINNVDGFAQGEVQNFFGKLSEITDKHAGLTLGEGANTVRSVRDAIKNVRDPSVLDTASKGFLLDGATGILGVLEN